MKFAITTIFIAASAYGTSASAIIRCEIDGMPINVSNGAELAGRSGLVRCKEEATGHIQRELDQFGHGARDA